MKTALATLALSLGNIMSAQSPPLNVNDYLKQVRLFASGSPDFAKIAAQLGVDATLSTLGPGASLVAAIRNDSGQAAEVRILYQGAGASNLEVERILPNGAVALAAPPEVAGALARLLNAGRAGLIAGSPTVQSLGSYHGTTTVSIDSATLADGTFIGSDTRQIFNELVEKDKAVKKFFNDLVVLLAASPTEDQVREAIHQRQSKIDFGSDLASIAESGLCDEVLGRMTLGQSLNDWAAAQNATWQAKPITHR